MRFPFFFDPKTYEFVLDHRPESDPVVPFVSVVDILYTFAHKHTGPCVLKDIRLIKGIIVPDFSNGYAAEVVIDQETKTISLICDDIIHYRASFELSEPYDNVLPEICQSQTIVLPNYDFLFHGPMLHSIDKIYTDMPQQGAKGILKTAQCMNWPKTDWFFDPFVCDGALQMGCQLAFMVKNKASLPSKIRQATFFKKSVTPYINVELRFQKISGLHYVFDVYIFDDNYQNVCRLEGVESYFRLR